MDRRGLSERNKKILKRLNEKYNLGYELLTSDYDHTLMGVIGKKCVWIYMNKGKVEVETSLYVKGSKYKRTQEMEEYVLDERKMKQTEQKFWKKYEPLVYENKKEEIRSLFVKEEKNETTMVNQNMIKLVKYVSELKKEEANSYLSEKETQSKVTNLFEKTGYENYKKYVPLLQGLERHRKYKIKYAGKTAERDILKTASGKVIAYTEEESLKIYENEKQYNKNELERMQNEIDKNS